MKIEFTIDKATEARLRTLLASLEIPMTALGEMAKESLGSLDDCDDGFIAEGFTYPDRSTALRVASRLLEKYPGSSEMELTYKRGRKKVSEDFQVRKALPSQFLPAGNNCVAFTTHLPSDHMTRVRELVAMLEIPEAAIETNFRAALESDVWRDDWNQWTIDFVYPNRQAAARVAKRVARRLPNDRTEIQLKFLEDEKQVTESFVV